jgi:hypothetical protein
MVDVHDVIAAPGIERRTWPNLSFARPGCLSDREQCTDLGEPKPSVNGISHRGFACGLALRVWLSVVT